MKYLLWCANAHINFRLPELKAIASFYKIPIQWCERKSGAPYIIVELHKEEDALKLTKRSMFIRSCYELWAEGVTDEQLHSNIKKCLPSFNKHITSERDFRLSVTTFNKKLTKEQKYNKILSFSYIPFQGNVNLNNPEMVLSLIEYYGIVANSIPQNPYVRFFGRWLADGDRELSQIFSLKNRNFIGTTSMDAELAFVMSNMAQVGPGSIVVDPFVGTGSILVSAAKRGAYVWGWDIDYLTLHAKTKPTRFKQKFRDPSESVLANLDQYGLADRYLDVVVMDSSKPMWRNLGFIDAIITDPPYGVRESTERVGLQKGSDIPDLNGKSVHESFPEHYPPKINYNIVDILVDLLNFSAAYLKMGGHLVYWLPVSRDDYTDKVIPHHPCLQLNHNSEQILSSHTSRRLITMVKTAEPKENDEADASELAKMEEFKLKFSQASQSFHALSKEEKRMIKKKFPMDKRGQGYVGYESEISTGPDDDSCINYISSKLSDNFR